MDAKQLKRLAKAEQHTLRMACLAPMSALNKTLKPHGLRWSNSPRKFLARVLEVTGKERVPFRQLSMKDIYRRFCSLADEFSPAWQPNQYGAKVDKTNIVNMPKPKSFAKPSDKYKQLRVFLKTTDGMRLWLQTRYEVLKRQPNCVLCGRGRAQGVTLHVDHIKPKSLYPDLAFDLDNLQTLCEECNMGKGNMDETDFR